MLLHNSVTEDPTIWAGLNHPELSLEDVDVAVFGIPYDGGVSFRSGTCEAPQELRKITHTISPTTEDFRDISPLKVKDLGDCVKYIKVTNQDKRGKNIKPQIEIDQAKVAEDLKYAGYNLMVTSELDMDPLQVYETYHRLWKIEESFRLTKSFLDARPVYVQKKETIYGHFLICYLSLFLLRVLEIKIFKNKVSAYDLIHFMRDLRVVSRGDGSYINISRDQAANEKVKAVTGLANLDALFLSEKEVENFFQNCMLLNT